MKSEAFFIGFSEKKKKIDAGDTEYQMPGNQHERNSGRIPRGLLG